MTPSNFNLRFDPTEALQAAEKQLQESFKRKCRDSVDAFFETRKDYGPGGVVIDKSGVGALMIREFLEKKFDDPKTLTRMDAYFEHNFDRVMEETMQKALQHKANAFVFGKAAKAEVKQV